MKPKYFVTFLKFLVGYGALISLIEQSGETEFVNLHLMLDTSIGVLSLLLAAFLLSSQYRLDERTRSYLIIAFSFAAFTEILHALVGIKWVGMMHWVQTYSETLRPVTWPPSTYVLPIALAWLLRLEQQKSRPKTSWFVVTMTLVTLLLMALSWVIPSYIDTGIVGIQRPSQIPLLLLWLWVIRLFWKKRAEHPLFEGLAWMGVFLFLSDLCMLFSTSPHEKFTMFAHIGKFIAYLFMHVVQMRVARDDSAGRSIAEEKIMQLAFYDVLTHLPNRRLMNDRLEKALALSSRSGHHGAIMFIDLDNFKPLNDEYGHAAGDLLLIEIARRLIACMREIDTVARLGGDEFLVILGELKGEKVAAITHAAKVAEKFLALIAEPYTLALPTRLGKSTVDFQCSASIGVAMFKNHEVNIKELINRSDQAMYRAKQDGRNQIQFYEELT